MTMGGSGMDGSWLFRGLIVVGAVLIVVLIVRVMAGRGRVASRPAGVSGRSAACQLLDQRYARGELTSEEYQERVRTLSEGNR
jgi:putative membrane protein